MENEENNSANLEISGSQRRQTRQTEIVKRKQAEKEKEREKWLKKPKNAFIRKSKAIGSNDIIVDTQTNKIKVENEGESTVFLPFASSQQEEQQDTFPLEFDIKPLPEEQSDHIPTDEENIFAIVKTTNVKAEDGIFYVESEHDILDNETEESLLACPLPIEANSNIHKENEELKQLLEQKQEENASLIEKIDEITQLITITLKDVRLETSAGSGLSGTDETNICTENRLLTEENGKLRSENKELKVGNLKQQKEVQVLEQIVRVKTQEVNSLKNVNSNLTTQLASKEEIIRKMDMLQTKLDKLEEENRRICNEHKASIARQRKVIERLKHNNKRKVIRIHKKANFKKNQMMRKIWALEQSMFCQNNLFKQRHTLGGKGLQIDKHMGYCEKTKRQTDFPSIQPPGFTGTNHVNMVSPKIVLPIAHSSASLHSAELSTCPSSSQPAPPSSSVSAIQFVIDQNELDSKTAANLAKNNTERLLFPVTVFQVCRGDSAAEENNGAALKTNFAAGNGTSSTVQGSNKGQYVCYKPAKFTALVVMESKAERHIILPCPPLVNGSKMAYLYHLLPLIQRPPTVTLTSSNENPPAPTIPHGNK